MDRRSCGQKPSKRAKASMTDTNRTREEYPKDSLDRYGDDLCGLVLSDLSLEECFRFECVSKQWQRSVFKPQNYVNVEKHLKKWQIIKGKTIEDIDWQILESVVRKCPNIRRFDIEIHSEVTGRVFETLMSAYKHLTAIDITFDTGINAQIIDTILGKHGSQLTAISIPPSGYDVFETHSKSLTRLRQLSSSGHMLLSTIVTENYELLVKNLTHFRFNYTNWQTFIPFVIHYRKILRSLSITFNSRFITTREYILILILISKMQSLRELNIELFFANEDTADTIDPVVDYHCKVFVNQWPHLKRYRLNMWCGTDLHVKRLYESVGRMKRLQRLELTLRPRPADNEWTVDLTPKALSPLKRLTHLSLRLENCILNESFFESFHSQLPHIKCHILIQLSKEVTDFDAIIQKFSKAKDYKFLQEIVTQESSV
ncbi:unnamed protein product [Oppiella nova]|uniref:F-box domain-containing protein n=1 Tax=Oppiella nova TaxID=334625 RepID=A0A7R9LU06_9ACAR|nr:unnamed protein product [Oppiella nova]CAG2166333.1 unnamed protein product [Oppiella nova]